MIDSDRPVNVDVAIVGAGVAGLAALRALTDAGLSACVLEGRDRIGGRMYTLHDERLPHGIELGAEFIHGSAPELVDLADEAGLTPFIIEGDRWRPRGKRLAKAADYWRELHKVMRYLPESGSDESFEEFLEREPGGKSAGEARTLAKQFVEGFHAAQPRKISAKALADGGAPSEDPEEQRIMRIPGGYDGVTRWLASGQESQILTETIVESIEWEQHRVSISARDRARRSVVVNARAAIVTAPLAVVFCPPGESGPIAFDPMPPILEKMHGRLTTGSVQRAVFLFRERWWTEKLPSMPKGGSLENLSFLYGDSEDYPVWWTLYPAHLPAMVGWAGGPAALRLAGKPYEEKRDRAIAALARNLRVSTRRVESQVVEMWTHDWNMDPFARGAYSYSMVGGMNAAAQLARGIQGTLWFAGEAADAKGRNGTVNGAIGSGRAAAKAVKRALT
ncbi:MAG: flavin monoamine oxidase family protein [Gemmatimonadaceae bacterium]